MSYFEACTEMPRDHLTLNILYTLSSKGSMQTPIDPGCNIAGLGGQLTMILDLNPPILEISQIFLAKEGTHFLLG